MKSIRLLTFTGLATASLVLFAGRASAQGPLYDKVIVDLPYSVTLNDTTLSPGHYVIRQFESQSGASRILQIYSNDGMKLEATAQTIPALDNNTPEKTSVVLHHYGRDYYFDKVWVQGKNYGYEFPLPPSVKAREKERMEPYTVAARYEAAQPEQPQVAQNTPPPAPEPAPPAPQPEAATAPALQPPPVETQRMPTTATPWGLEIAAGVLLAGLGLMLRRRIA